MLVALGDFGRSAASRLKSRVRTRVDERRPDVAIVDLPLPEEFELQNEHARKWLGQIETAVIEEVSGQLALSALVEREPVEGSSAWLDVIVVGDLSERPVRVALQPLIDVLEQVVVRRFPNLLGRDGARLVVLPLLAIGETCADDGDGNSPSLDSAKTLTEKLNVSKRERARSGSGIKEVAQALAQRKTPKTRTFLFESHTSKYILSQDELVSTAVAMVELLVLAGLREAKHLAGFLNDESPRTPGSSPEPAPFGTFGVASVRVDAELIHGYCRNRASIAVVEAMRVGLDLGLEEREEMARALRLRWDDVRERLGLAAKSDAAFEQVEKIVLEEAPTFPCPEIDARDTPEAIRDRKFGDDWYRNVGGSIDQLIDRLERRRMQELSAKIDASGLKIARRRRQSIREVVNGWVWEKPQGWSAARSTLSLLRDEAAAAEAEASRRVNSRALPVLPTPEQLHKPVIAVRHEAERRPRSFRLWLTGLLLVVPAILFGYQLLALLRYPLQAWDAPTWLINAVSPPWGLIPTSVVALVVIGLALRSVVLRHHREIGEVRDELKRSIQRLINGREGSVLAYYLARLELARELWVLRLAALERRQLENELDRLDEVQRALDTRWDQLRAAQRQLGVRYLDEVSTEEDLSQIAPRGDLILRDAADGTLLDATYLRAAQDEDELVASFFTTLSSPRPEWRLELPMADSERVRSFLDGVLELPGPGELLVSHDAVAATTARDAVKHVLTELSTRLSPSLGLTEEALRGNSSMVITAPAAATSVVDDALEALRSELDLDAFGSEWLRLTSPRDDGRVYLSALVTHLPWTAIGALSR